MSTWEERMSARHVESAHRLALDMNQAESEAARLRKIAREKWAAWVESHGGYWGYVFECQGDCHETMWLYPPTSEPERHANHRVFSHAHYFHGNRAADAVTGLNYGGCWSIALSDDMPPMPDSCPVCDNFNLNNWS